MVPAATGHRHRRLAAHPLGALRARRRSSRRAAAVSLRGVVPLAYEPRPRGADGAHARGLRAAARGAWPGPIPGRPASALAGAAAGSAAARAARGAGRSRGCGSRSRPRALGRARSTPTSQTVSRERLAALRGARRRRSPSRPRRRSRSRSATTSSTCSAVELLVYHRRFDGRRDRYRPSLREWIEGAEARGSTAERYVDAQRGGARRRPAFAALARRAAHRCAARADRALHRPAARRRLRPRRQRLSR